jgi:hypothetical protein
MVGLAGSGAAALDCEAPPGAGQPAESRSYTVAWQTAPSPPRVGEHFVVDFAVCPKAGARPAGSVAIDATMPDHRHGMNYRPSVAALAPGRYRAQGLLFHMPGRWVVVFDIVAGTATERASAEIVLR